MKLENLREIRKRDMRGKRRKSGSTGNIRKAKKIGRTKDGSKGKTKRSRSTKSDKIGSNRKRVDLKVTEANRGEAKAAEVARAAMSVEEVKRTRWTSSRSIPRS